MTVEPYRLGRNELAIGLGHTVSGVVEAITIGQNQLTPKHREFLGRMVAFFDDTLKGSGEDAIKKAFFNQRWSHIVTNCALAYATLFRLNLSGKLPHTLDTPAEYIQKYRAAIDVYQQSTELTTEQKTDLEEVKVFTRELGDLLISLTQV